MNLTSLSGIILLQHYRGHVDVVSKAGVPQSQAGQRRRVQAVGPVTVIQVLEPRGRQETQSKTQKQLACGSASTMHT